MALPEEFDSELRELRRRIEAAGYLIRAVWMDEYGGSQSVILNNTDTLVVERGQDFPR